MKSDTQRVKGEALLEIRGLKIEGNSDGVWHPIGGCNALTQAMADAATEMGTQIHCGAPVQRILFEGTKACGVVVNGTEHRHDHVVVNAMSRLR